MDTSREHIQRAVNLAGSQRALAEKAEISQQLVSWLLNHADQVSAEVAVAIERATEGAVTRAQLRPDLFGDQASDSAARLSRNEASAA